MTKRRQIKVKSSKKWGRASCSPHLLSPQTAWPLLIQRVRVLHGRMRLGSSSVVTQNMSLKSNSILKDILENSQTSNLVW